MASVTCLPVHMKPRLDIKTCQPIITEITQCVEFTESTTSPSEMSPRVKRIDPPGTDTATTARGTGPDTGAKSPTSPIQTKRSRRETASRPASATNSSSHSRGHSQSHSRSASRSTVRSSPNSRRSSLHSARRTVPNPAIVPVPTTRTSPQERRESLIALHRDSCRLFQDEASTSKDPSAEVHTHTRPRQPSLHRRASSTTYPRRDSRASEEKGNSAPSSPIAPSASFASFRFEPEAAPPFLASRDRSYTMPSHSNVSPAKHHHSPSTSSIHVPATVIEWTSPSTRRREYEKIDRASSGMRGLWRRVAPRCLQTRESRTLFFEEGKHEREGSVRRFRMDIPEDEETGKESVSPTGKSQVQLLDFLSKHTSSNSLSRSNYSPSPDGSRRRWACLRSKTSSA
ncbi:hypothetical protein N7522_010953 [Penicillium canescens]|uniref:Uncharacterized protein n=1 Tax=Penicillium canescens TaxID=5083 RepID=A0AAD6NDQ2_PENCN|nr:uncharacterized protein N7446_006549 [Penicillium canescens]KAJ5990746.1 hypothetical protein N7522_010953 [Penicillium canescens]KAJ6051912.1 hypothetical protein N7460_002446 [Penicillium canescens]KAJ6062429.1 hypothetical protein N7446_006549 [Penicillium canescens]KAJ6065676.1 hypothetical protein N7444_001329 [Penicillium canescens]